jgi:hypothetical protein
MCPTQTFSLFPAVVPQLTSTSCIVANNHLHEPNISTQLHFPTPYIVCFVSLEDNLLKSIKEEELSYIYTTTEY